MSASTPGVSDALRPLGRLTSGSVRPRSSPRHVWFSDCGVGVGSPVARLWLEGGAFRMFPLQLGGSRRLPVWPWVEMGGPEDVWAPGMPGGGPFSCQHFLIALQRWAMSHL